MRLGARVPVGIAYVTRRSILDVFLEVVPLLDLVPNTDFGLNAAIGIRYRFGTRPNPLERSRRHEAASADHRSAVPHSRL